MGYYVGGGGVRVGCGVWGVGGVWGGGVGTTVGSVYSYERYITPSHLFVYNGAGWENIQDGDSRSNLYTCEVYISAGPWR